MTLLSDVIRALHDADVPSYSVRSTAHDLPGDPQLPGDPDLVVVTDGHAEQRAAEALSTAALPITSVRRVRQGVLHVWVVAPQRRPTPYS